MKGRSAKLAAAVSYLCLLAWQAFGGEASGCLLKEGGRLAIIGDSITEQKLYSVYIEAYLLAAQPALKQDVCQFGWAGERASGFLGRMDNDMASWFKPDVATLCFGMNDGRYVKLNPEIEKAYEEPLRKILGKLKDSGAKAVNGGPGAVDTKFFAKPSCDAATYNASLAKLSELAAKISSDCGAVYVPLHRVMTEAMTKAKASNGEGFPVCGADGVHPGPDGHLAMAYAFLKGLGVDGRIASIRVAMDGGAPALSSGHKALSFSKGLVELESSRHPFCFYGEKGNPAGTVSMLPFLPAFNEELNRFELQVSGLKSAKAKVSWGQAAKTFSRESLEKGVNLAAEFVEENPFKERFEKLLQAVSAKQAFETFMVKSCVSPLARLEQDPLCAAEYEALKAKLAQRRAALRDAARAVAQPLRHSIRVEPLD